MIWYCRVLPLLFMLWFHIFVLLSCFSFSFFLSFFLTVFCWLFQLQYLPPPWGDCKSTPIDSEYFSTYSITACRIDCETRYLLENCNCRMVHMPGENCDFVIFWGVVVGNLHMGVSLFHVLHHSNRDLHGLHTWTVQGLCWSGFRWVHTCYTTLDNASTAFTCNFFHTQTVLRQLVYWMK